MLLRSDHIHSQDQILDTKILNSLGFDLEMITGS